MMIEGHPRFELVKPLGEGNFGVARLERERATGELVAIKYIPRGRGVRGLLSRAGGRLDLPAEQGREPTLAPSALASPRPGFGRLRRQSELLGVHRSAVASQGAGSGSFGAPPPFSRCSFEPG